MKENRAEIFYIFGAVLLLGLLGVYLAINQSNAFTSLVSNPFVRRNSDTDIQISIVPSVLPLTTDTAEIMPSISQVEDIGLSAIMKTNLGNLKIRLFEKAAPNTVANFKRLSQNEYYSGTTFHRFIPDVLLQGGSRNTINDDPEDDNTGGPGYTIPDEINWESLGFTQEKKDMLTDEGYTSIESVDSEKMRKFVLAMANDGPNTGGSQFFIVLSDDSEQLSEMEGRYTVFGEIIEGKNIIDKISQMPINLDDLDSPRPSEEIEIENIQFENN